MRILLSAMWNNGIQLRTLIDRVSRARRVEELEGEINELRANKKKYGLYAIGLAAGIIFGIVLFSSGRTNAAGIIVICSLLAFMTVFVFINSDRELKKKTDYLMQITKDSLH